MGVHTCLYTTKIDYEEWSSVSQTSMCCLSEASNFTKRSVREYHFTKTLAYHGCDAVRYVYVVVTLTASV